jgi:DNA-3-methyladenine glycosylase II
MFLMFTLHRPDVLPVGDVGIRNAFKAAYGEDAVLTEVAHAWRPYRTRASLYLWRSLENTPT